MLWNAGAEDQSFREKLYVWTADEEKVFERMISYGVDGIVTNEPDRLIEYLKNISSLTSPNSFLIVAVDRFRVGR
ncbi:MAG: hypothetical protein IPM55_08605 [Acidobacteria bacterium]|nr:hypothetical protein [Acidobacteriota bacterium]